MARASGLRTGKLYRQLTPEPARTDVHEYVRAHFGPGFERPPQNKNGELKSCRGSFDHKCKAVAGEQNLTETA
eukprot:scaffold95643_cov58-Phaeocystis_antarctica.AAC.7